MKIAMSNWADATALLNSKPNIIIITHLSPDGDAIGTLLGLTHALREMGKTVTPAVDDGVPATLAFLPGADGVRKQLDGVEADLVIAVDCGDEARMGKMGEAARKLSTPLINIDHHWSNTRFGDINLIESEWVSATEAVYDWLETLQFSLSPTVAQCILCGLVTDTQCFRTDSTKSNTLGKAQKLIEAGANLSTIVQHTVSRISTNTLRLWSQVMPTVKIEDNIVWVKVTIEARKAAGSASNGSGDTKDGGLSSLLVQADDAYISCVMHEKENNKVELSFRAVPGFDTSVVAVSLGGGGHKLASGATVSGTIEEVEAKVIPLLKEAARVGQPTSV
jgi:bifunctional oligoribonuclease and PAP phosphatase NrnA